jgi:hypothetical protein
MLRIFGYRKGHNRKAEKKPYNMKFLICASNQHYLSDQVKWDKIVGTCAHMREVRNA